jgi:X-Pro dipeptidyl-peptidase
VTYATPTVTDNEDPSPDISCTPASGSTFGVGQTRVTCTATDANGNVATKTFTVTVRGLLNVGATVPATLSLTLGAPASFGAFTPGVAQTYTATTTATVISTAGDAALEVADPSATHTGHLVNGAFALPQPLQGLGTVKTYGAPVSNDVVTVQFRQPVSSTDALRTGVYSKTLTFTLSTTNP